ncbi:MAG TPA: MBL fold metallo-hydrolase [Desulfobacterales bacterium]|nr:MBL fold metallo-hydrolase [Desulfobacterales bacterium]
MIDFKSYASSSKGNLYSVSDGKTNILIECGLPIAKIKKHLKFKLHDYTACLISHMHADHSKSIHQISAAGLDIYCLSETAQALKFKGHRLNVIEPLRQFKIGSYSIVPIEINHQDVITGERIPGVGFLISDGIDKLLYYIDSFYCKYTFGQLGIIALGVNYSKKTMNPNLNTARKKRLFKSHMSLETAIKFFKANDLSKVREIHILHISSENGDPEYFRSEIMKATGKPVYA